MTAFVHEVRAKLSAQTQSDVGIVQVALVSVTIHDIICGASATGCCDITVFVRSQTSDINVMWQLFADNEYGVLARPCTCRTTSSA